MTVDDDARWVRDHLERWDPVADGDRRLDPLVSEVREDLRARIDVDDTAVDAPTEVVPATSLVVRGEPLPTERRVRRLATRGRRRSCPWAAAAGVVLLLGVLGAVRVTSMGDGDGDAVTVGHADPAGPARSKASESVTTADGVELRMETSSPVVAGTRTPATFTIRNVSKSAIFWQAGGCGEPVASVLGPAGYQPPPAGADRTWWDGTMPTLESWVTEHNALNLNAPHQAEDATAQRSRFCSADSDMQQIEPGAEVVHAGSFEARVPPGPLPAGGSYAVTSTFTWYANPSDYGADGTGTSMTSTTAVEVVDDPERSEISAIDALGAATASPLGDWIESTDLSTTSGVDQTYSAELSWWRSEWELWVTPQYFDAGTRPFRLRYDPASGATSDVRTVQSGQPPADEPGAVIHSSALPDELLITLPKGAPPDQPTPTTITAPESRPPVPDLVGMDMGQAYERMIAVGFDPTTDANLTSTWIATDASPEGTVLGQDPPAGGVLQQGERVRITVSAGGPVIGFDDLPSAAATFTATLEGFDPGEPILRTDTEGGAAYKTDKWLFGPCPAVRLAYRTYGDPSYGDRCYD